MRSERDAVFSWKLSNNQPSGFSSLVSAFPSEKMAVSRRIRRIAGELGESRQNSGRTNVSPYTTPDSEKKRGSALLPFGVFASRRLRCTARKRRVLLRRKSALQTAESHDEDLNASGCCIQESRQGLGGAPTAASATPATPAAPATAKASTTAALKAELALYNRVLRANSFSGQHHHLYVVRTVRTLTRKNACESSRMM